MTDVDENAESGGSRRGSWTIVVLLVVIAVFAGVLLATARADRGRSVAQLDTSTTLTGSTSSSITSVHNDAEADYQAALKTGRPIYVLFHSLT